MIQYNILNTGFFFADGGAMFGAIPKRAWNRKYPSDEQNCCRMAMNCVLAWNEDRVILLDTGVGDKSLDKLSYYRFHETKDLTELIRMHGFEPEQVTDVVLSHLHFDHCGGCTSVDESGKLKVNFPKAIHWVGRAQWKNYFHPNGLEKDSFRPQDLMPVYESGLLRCIDSDMELTEGFSMKLFDGHTPGQIVSIIETEENEFLMFPGDVIPTRAHLPAEWISAYDTHPLKSLAAKEKLRKIIEGRKGSIVFYHDAYHLISEITPIVMR
jgi:glyoxylase-like metal-dependent hydrolase (beta-lactamase superfamily II)